MTKPTLPYRPPSPKEWEAMTDVQKLDACRAYLDARRVLSTRMARWALSKFKVKGRDA